MHDRANGERHEVLATAALEPIELCEEMWRTAADGRRRKNLTQKSGCLRATGQGCDRARHQPDQRQTLRERQTDRIVWTTMAQALGDTQVQSQRCTGCLQQGVDTGPVHGIHRRTGPQGQVQKSRAPVLEHREQPWGGGVAHVCREGQTKLHGTGFHFWPLPGPSDRLRGRGIGQRPQQAQMQLADPWLVWRQHKGPGHQVRPTVGLERSIGIVALVLQLIVFVGQMGFGPMA